MSLTKILDLSNIVSDLSGLSNNIDGLTQKVKGLSLEDAKLVMNLAEVDAYTQSCTLSNLGYSASAINAANGVMADKVATDADTTSKYANLKVTNLLKVAWSKFTAFAMANPWLVGIAAGALAIFGIAKAIDLFTTSMEEASEATTDAISELSSITSEVETLEGKIADLKSQIDGLDPITNEDQLL